MRDPIEVQFDADDVQSLILPGHGGLRAARFLRFSIQDRTAAGNGLGDLPATAGEGHGESAVQIAFTAPGLTALGLDPETLARFSRRFQEGMSTSPQACRALGDVGINEPGRWRWGHPADSVHGLLLLYAEGDAQLERLEREVLSGELARGCAFTPMTDPTTRAGDPPFHEHFGFADGIGNPVIEGAEQTRGLPHNMVARGEILLGYPDQDGRIPPSPHIDPGGGADAPLPDGDLGRNGSYLVVRQLEQRVEAFWRFLLGRAGDPEVAIRIAAKMVGRWPNGAPLARWPNAQPPEPPRDADDFLYRFDPQGLGCPLGAHVRRTNPRDALHAEDPKTSVEKVRRRRILRRGRIYGDPVPGWPDPYQLMKQATPQDDGDRGLHFLCFNADIESQYEFVQQTWINSRKFSGLSNDADPLLSNPDSPFPDRPSDFSIQAQPTRRRIQGLEAFVTVRGGGYFFMPGIRALRYLASRALVAGE